jgi:hypothetical protein
VEHFTVYAGGHRLGTMGVMPIHTPESQFVRRVMPKATAAEIEEATRRWFAFLQILNRITNGRNTAHGDSRESRPGDNFEGIPPVV